VIVLLIVIEHEQDHDHDYEKSGEPLLGGFGGLAFFVSALESFNASCSIQQLLFAREEGMAIRTNFDADFFFRRACCESIPASTNHFRFGVNGMNTFFHWIAPTTILEGRPPCLPWASGMDNIV
jgi:hypothetical protein